MHDHLEQHQWNEKQMLIYEQKRTYLTNTATTPAHIRETFLKNRSKYISQENKCRNKHNKEYGTL
jgi:hypothetical protein